MKLGPEGAALIKSFEGCKLAAYRDSAGVPTIGWGHSSAAGAPVVKAGMTITQAEADAIFMRDAQRFVDRVNALVKVPLKQNEFDALVSFDFNTGALDRSTLLKRLNAGRKDLVPTELMAWTKAGGKTLRGLVRRRQAEVDLFTAETKDIGVATPTVAVEVAAPKASMATSKTGNAAIVSAAAATIPLADTVSQIATAATSAHDSVAGAIKAFGLPLLACVVIIGAGVLIWFLRRQQLREDAS
ncbi:lysozyme [Methylocella sp.]|uniref:lysozyme n=1 Tax=Methylocella sp. TaxID=1978226 RepID=UPI0035B12830